MLKTIEIENFLTIEQAKIDLSDKITAIIGESGSGKSLILKAIENVFSPKTDTSFVGNFKDSTKIDLLFKLNDNQLNKLEEFGILDEEIAITKIIKKGKSKAYINHEPVTQKVLTDIKFILVDLISQDYRFELFHSSLLMDTIDKLIDKKIKKTFLSKYKEFKKLKNKERELKEILNSIAKTHAEILIEAIKKVNPKKGEYEELIKLSKQAKSNVLAKEISTFAINALFENENNIESVLNSLILKLDKLKQSGINIHSYDIIVEALDKIVSTKDEFYEMLNRTFNQEEIDKINKRLFELEKLQRQFGMPIDQIIEEKKNLEQLLKKKEKIEAELDNINLKLSKVITELNKAAEALSEERKKAASILQKTIKKELEKLNLSKSKVVIQIEEKSIDEDGKDKIIVMFSANPDLEPQSLYKVASGGEKSRFVLALKKSLSLLSNTKETVLFDEIEAGLSSEALDSTLKSIKEYSKNSQIVLITHNDKVKTLANKVYIVRKLFENKKTKSLIEKIK